MHEEDEMSLPDLIAVARGDKAADLVLKNASIINVFTSSIEKNSVAVYNGRIAGIGDYAEGRKVIDLRGKTLMPGLIDAHRHIISVTDLEVTPELIVLGAIEGVRVAHEALSMGITTVRDPGCKHNGIFRMKQAIDEGSIPGPTVYPTGPNPTGSAAPASATSKAT